MKNLLTMLWLAAAMIARADEIEPAVNTSNVAPPPPVESPPASPAPKAAPATKSASNDIEPAVRTSDVAPAAPAAPPPASTAPKAPSAKGAPPAKQAANRKPGSRDEIELDPTQITGNKELPKVMYVVPWKRPDIGDMSRPAKSLIDEVLAPVDRDVFRRQNRYFATLQAQTAAGAAKPTVAPAAGATITLPNRDEK
jgi:hypothetical protein